MATVRDGVASFLTSSSARPGLDGPMPTTIALVVVGRYRPSPDRVPEGASSDPAARGIVTGHGSGVACQRLAPVLLAPPRGVGRIDRDDHQAQLGGHGDKPGLELACGHAGNQLPE